MLSRGHTCRLQKPLHKAKAKEKKELGAQDLDDPEVLSSHFRLLLPLTPDKPPPNMGDEGVEDDASPPQHR